MKISLNIVNHQTLGFLFIGLFLFGATAMIADAQRDPFAKPVVAAPRPKRVVSTGGSGGSSAPKEKVKPLAPGVVAAPPIQQRIDSYRVVRQRCAELGIACPKPTSVLTLDEMQVTGVFRTPRGYAAMVEAKPIKLSYTIYPGEKFYDGQLVAIEETKLVFRRVTRMSDGKELVGVDSKILRQASINDLAVTREETPAANPTAVATAPANAGGISAEAVPINENKTAAVEPEAEVEPAAAKPAPKAKVNPRANKSKTNPNKGKPVRVEL